MKICSCVVIYNPDECVYKNILGYSKFVNEVILVDNSDKESNTNKKLLTIPNIKYIHNAGNLGIAYALKIGLEYAIEKNYDWCLTMDQDSELNLSNDKFNSIIQILEKNTNYGIISCDYNNLLKDKFNKTKKQIIDVKTWITSGNFINVKQYKKIEGFNKNLFIDYVDFDLCRQFYYKNIKIGIINHSLKHKIGTPITIKIFDFSFNCMNHSPVRYYYRYRNAKYLYQKNKIFYIKIYLHERIVDFLKMIIFEKNKKEKLIMIKKGLKDAKNNKLGPYQNKKKEVKI